MRDSVFHRIVYDEKKDFHLYADHYFFKIDGVWRKILKECISHIDEEEKFILLPFWLIEQLGLEGYLDD